MSDCSQFDDLIARLGQLDDGELRRLEEHTATCSACRELAATMQPSEEPDGYGDLAKLPKVDPAFYVREIKVGEGGMGVTWRAHDRRLGRSVVIKELKADDGAAFRGRFEREARLTARLQHPAIVSVHEVGEWPDGQPFYAMELVRGRPLDEEIARRKTVAERLSLLPALVKVAEAIAYAHGQRVVHRDLTPRNVLVGEFGEVVVIDWGLAKDLDEAEAPMPTTPYRSDGLTELGAGTPSFMPPEQAAGLEPDERVDVYALGAILYTILAGEPPYLVNKQRDIRRQLIDGPPAPVEQLAPECPSALASIVARAMARDPRTRIGNAHELADELERYQTGLLVESHRYTLRELLANWMHRHRRGLRLGAAAVVALGVIGGIAIMRVVEERDQSNRMVARLLFEEGQRELAAGSPLRAAPLLAESYRRDPSPTPTRVALASALRSLDAHRFTLRGHHDHVDDLEWSHDGTTVLTHGGDGSLWLWNAATGAPTVVIDQVRIADARLSPDGHLFATADGDGHVRLRDVRDGAPRLVLEADHGVSKLVRFSPDGARLATSGSDRVVRIWDARSGTQLAHFFAGTPSKLDGVIDIRWGTKLVVVTSHVVYVFDADTFESIASTAPDHWHGPQGVAVPIDGNEISHSTLESAGNAVAVLDMAGRIVRLDSHRKPVLALAYSPDGTLLIGGTSDGDILVWSRFAIAVARAHALFHADIAPIPPMIELRGHSGGVRHLAFDGDGKRFVSAGNDGVARVWDTASGAILATLAGHEGAVRTAAFDPSGRWIGTASLDQTARIWNLEQAIESRTLPMGDSVTAVSIGPDGSLATGDSGGTAILWDRNGHVRATLPGSGRITTIAFHPDGRRVLVAGWSTETRLWDTSGKLLAALPGDDWITCAAWSPDGALLATGDERGRARIWRGSNSHELVGHTDGITSLAFDVTGSILLTGSHDGAARLWNTDDGSLRLVVRHPAGIRAVAFGRDGRFATASESGVATLWDREGNEIAVLQHPQALWWVGFSPAGDRVLTTSSDHVARVFDADDGRLLLALAGHDKAVVSAAWSADGSEIATGSHDGGVRLWDATSGKLISKLVGRGQIGAVTFGANDLVLAADLAGAGLVWDVHPEGRSLDAIAAMALAVPWRLVDTALVPVGAMRVPEPHAHLDQETCDSGESFACARVIHDAYVMDVLPIDGGEVVLFVVRHPGAPRLVDPYGGENMGGDIYVATITDASIRPVLLARDSWPPQVGSLGRHGDTLLAFANVRRRHDTYANDGLLWRIDSGSRVTRDVVYTEWNAGYAAVFENGELVHWSFSSDRVVRGKERTEDPKHAGETWIAAEARHRRSVLDKLGEWNVTDSLDAIVRAHLVQRWPQWFSALRGCPPIGSGEFCH